MLVQKIIKLSLSDMDRYFTWTAAVKEGVFKSSAKNRKKESLTESYNILGLTPALSELFDSISSSRSKRENLLKAQRVILELRGEYQEEVKELLAVKNRLLDKAEQLSSVVKGKVLSLFPVKKTLDVLLWMHEVTLASHF